MDARRPYVSSLGLFTATGRVWTLGDGDFPFEDADICVNSLTLKNIERAWFCRKAGFELLNAERKRLGMSWNEYYGTDD